MTKSAFSLEDVLAALPAVQAAVREEIAARIAVGEEISSWDAEHGCPVVLSERDGRRISRKPAQRNAA